MCAYAFIGMKAGRPAPLPVPISSPPLLHFWTMPQKSGLEKGRLALSSVDRRFPLRRTRSVILYICVQASGYRPMDTPENERHRLLEAAAALLSAAKDKRLNTTNLNKAVFYLDLFALRYLGAPVTRSAFIALKLGPVVAKYEKRLIKPLMEEGIAVQEEEGMAKPIRLVREPSSHFLSDE